MSILGADKNVFFAFSDHPMNGQQTDYLSEIKIIREGGPNRLAEMPVGDQPVFFGMHGPVAEHYGADPEQVEERNTTLDYVVAATAG